MQCHQQTEGGLSVPPLCSSETAPGVLPPVLGSSIQEIYAPVRAGPEVGHKNYQMREAPLPGRAVTVEVVQPSREERALGRTYCNSSVLKKGL